MVVEEGFVEVSDNTITVCIDSVRKKETDKK
jgi:F0F1-type ATP synthase epsilon subunit